MVDASGTAETGVARKPCSPVMSMKAPTIRPASLMPVGAVWVAPGTSSRVKLPPL